MHFVILFSVCILFGGASGCDMCKIDFGNFATCTGEDVCPLYASYVEVGCFIRNITTLVPIVQLRIRGNCGSIVQYVHLCKETQIKDIVMLDSTEKNHRCRGNYFFISLNGSLRSHF